MDNLCVNCRSDYAIVLSDIACFGFLLPHLSIGGLNASNADLVFVFIDCDMREMQADEFMGCSRVTGFNYDTL